MDRAGGLEVGGLVMVLSVAGQPLISTFLRILVLGGADAAPRVVPNATRGRPDPEAEPAATPRLSRLRRSGA